MPTTRRLAAAPLAAAYAIAPLAAVLIPGRAGGPLAGLVPDLLPGLIENGPWLVLAAFGLAFCLIPGAGRPRPSTALASLASGALVLCLAGLFALGSGLPGRILALTPVLEELRPLAYLLFAAMWVLTFGPPQRAALFRAGAWMGALVFLIQAGLSLYAAGAAQAQSGTATLLLVGLCAGFDPGREAAGPRDKAWTVRLGLVCLGLLSSLWPPALFAAVWISLFLCPGAWIRRVGLGLVFAGGLGLALWAAQTPAALADMLNRSWQWSGGLELLISEPKRLVLGSALGSPLPLAAPPALLGLLQDQGLVPGQAGVHVHDLGPFWLRITAAWGLAAPALVLAAFGAGLARAGSAFAVGLLAAALVQGMSSPLLFDSPVAIILYMALFMSLTKASKGAVPAGAGNGAT
ncbi:MAG: hypothetical protein JW718_00830 [Desulfovibrionaceae bacterium]|nr:hypothetical protein [Desulfovibrionaceae bacterium]